MPLHFDNYASKGNEFVQLVAEDLGIYPDKAGRIIRAVFHALRNRLPHEESFQLLSQLPMALKGVYVDGWKFSKDFNRISELTDFLDEVKQEDGNQAEYDFGDNAKAMAAITSVFKAMHYFVSDEEMNDIIAVMPATLKKIIKKSIAGNETVL